MAITINGSGTITGISAGGLPDGSVTADDIESSLDLSGKTVTLPSGTGGKVLQVVEVIDSTDRSTSSPSYVDAGISVTITPQSTSNKILLIWSSNTSAYHSGGTAASGRFKITDSSNNSIGGAVRVYNGPVSQIDTPLTLVRYHSPATTSAVTYKVRFRLDFGSTADIYNSFIGSGHFYAMEIAG